MSVILYLDVWLKVVVRATQFLGKPPWRSDRSMALSGTYRLVAQNTIIHASGNHMLGKDC